MTYQEAYQLLGINSQASMEEIKSAYKAKAKKYHPDIYQGDKKFAEKKMQKINEAYHFLTKRLSESKHIEEMRKATEQDKEESIKSQKRILKFSILGLIASIIAFMASVIIINASIHWFLSALFFFVGFVSFLLIILSALLFICAAYILKHTNYI